MADELPPTGPDRVTREVWAAQNGDVVRHDGKYYFVLENLPTHHNNWLKAGTFDTMTGRGRLPIVWLNGDECTMTPFTQFDYKRLSHGPQYESTGYKKHERRLLRRLGWHEDLKHPGNAPRGPRQAPRDVVSQTCYFV